MFPVGELLDLILETIPMYLLRQELLLVVGVILMLIHMQYARVAEMERRMFGRSLAQPLRQTFIALLFGLAGGVLGTALFVVLGISLTDAGILYLWVTAIFLMLLHPRFICFAYAGGILSLSHLIFGFPQLNVAAVMALVAALHLIEAVLIWVHGPRGATPVYVKAQDGQIIGGFTLQKFWPIPFVAMLGLFVSADAAGTADLLAMPDWWPLIGTDQVAPQGEQFVYVLLPVIAALGYGDIALARHPAQKARRTAVALFLYSVVLLGLALLADRMAPWQVAAALFSPLGHELVIYWGRRSEETGKPIFTAAAGAMVLDVLPGSVGQKMGLGPGDVIRRVNDYPVRNKEDLAHSIDPWAIGVEMEVENAWRADGTRKAYYPGKVPPLGLILVPDPNEGRFLDMSDRSRFGRLMARLERMWRRWAQRH